MGLTGLPHSFVRMFRKNFPRPPSILWEGLMKELYFHVFSTHGETMGGPRTCLQVLSCSLYQMKSLITFKSPLNCWTSQPVSTSTIAQQICRQRSGHNKFQTPFSCWINIASSLEWLSHSLRSRLWKKAETIRSSSHLLGAVEIKAIFSSWSSTPSHGNPKEVLLQTCDATKEFCKVANGLTDWNPLWGSPMIYLIHYCNWWPEDGIGFWWKQHPQQSQSNYVKLASYQNHLKPHLLFRPLLFLDYSFMLFLCTLFRLWFQTSFNKVVQLDHLSQWHFLQHMFEATIYLLCSHLICDQVWSPQTSIIPLSTLPSFSPSVRSPDTGEQSNAALVEKATELFFPPPETWLSGLPSSLRKGLDTGYLIIKLNHVRQSLLVLNPVALSAIEICSCTLYTQEIGQIFIYIGIQNPSDFRQRVLCAYC